MLKTISIFTLACIFMSVSIATVASDCSSELFPGVIVSKLYWDHEGESFVVGLGAPFANEYTYDYKLIRFENGATEVVDHPIIDPVFVINVVGKLGISKQFYDPSVDPTQLLLSPDHQTALYLKDNQLHIVDIERQTSSQIRLHAALGKIEQAIWQDDESFLLVATHPYGIGHEIIKGCLDHDCLSSLTDLIPAPIGSPAISPDSHYAIAPNAVEPDTLFLINLMQEGTFKAIHLPFDAQTDVPPVWSNNGDEVFLIGSETDSINIIYHIYRLTFAEESLIDATRVAEIDPDLASSTTAWLVDPIHQRSIYALRNGGLKIVCWQQ